MRRRSDYESTRADHDRHGLASLAEKKRLWWRNGVINGLFIASWFFFATMISLYNKWMFSPDHFGFPYPLLVTTFHMFVQFTLASCLRYMLPSRFKPDRSPGRRDYMKKVAPTGVMTAADIGLSNLSLKTVTLSFYTMVKTSSLIFVLAFAFYFRLETFSLRLLGVIALIFAGVLLMVATETHFVLGGFLLVLFGSASGGLRWALTQLLLRNHEIGLDNPAATLFWLSPVMGVSLAIVSLVLDDWWGLLGSKFFDGLSTSLHTIFLLLAPGVLAFSMVLSEFYILRRAGVVPMSIAGIAKEVTTISISAWLFGDELTPLNILGVGITICGIALYTYHKYRKALDSPVPLDAHGNPMEEEPLVGDANLELAETEPLAARMSMGRSRRDADDASTVNDAQTLFEVGDEDDGDAEELRSVTSAKLGGVRGERTYSESDEEYEEPAAGRAPTR